MTGMSNFLTKTVKPRTISIISFLALLLFMPLLIVATGRIANLITRAAGTPANIVVNTTRELEMLNLDYYHAFSQGGEEAANMLKPILNETKALKPKVLRIDHIYDYYNVVGKSRDQLSFNWAGLDDAVDTILASGATPILVLSYMPPAIAREGNITNPPDNWNEWATVVQKTIERYSGRNNKNIPGIYYEVWNEPDLALFGAWRTYGEKNYLTLYQYASVGAGNAQNTNNFFLGGPANTGLYKEWILALVKSGYRLDFLSWHTYQNNPQQFGKDQEDVIQWLLPYPKFTLIPKLITEFGFTGEKSPLYGTTYAAAYTAAVIRQLVSGGPRYALSFQPVDGPKQQSGEGWGLITHGDNGNKPKPRYWIYSFVDNMAGTRVSLSGEGTFVTGFASIRGDTTRVMLVNFDPNGSHSETVPVTFGNLTPGTYMYRQRYFLGQDVTVTETVTENSLTKRIYMAPSGVVLLEVTKQ
jgi:hypothetical protein